MNYIHYIIVTVAFLLVGGTNADAQTDRNLIRQGNRAFKSQKWAAAETQYRKAISKNQKNPQAIYNLGCALLAQQKDSLAMVQFGNAAQLESNIFRRSKSYHNMGVVMQNHREYAQAIEYYKMALRCNPQDNETRYNLALCKKLLKNNQQNQNNKNNKDKNKNDKNKDKKNDKKDQQKQQPDPQQMSKENAEQMLKAAMQDEKETQERLQKAQQKPTQKHLQKQW